MQYRNFRDRLIKGLLYGSGGHLFGKQGTRITLGTTEKWIYSSSHQSDMIRLQWLADRAKPAISFMDELGYNKTAIVSHNMANDSGSTDHRHISIETAMASGQLYTRLEVTYGADLADVRIQDANFICNGNPIWAGGGAATYRDYIMATNTGGNVYLKRWAFRCNNTAESGSNVGSDFEITRYTDTGGAVDSPFAIKRDTANIGFWLKATSDFGGGSRVIAIRNCVAAPTTNNTTGGMLYVVDGALTWRGSAGSVTTIAPA